MAIVGLRNTTDMATGERPENYREGILLNMPNGDTPMTALTAVMKTETTDDPAIHWFEKEYNAQRLQLTLDVDAVGSSETFTFAAGVVDQLTINTLLLSEQTMEIFLVTAIDTGAGTATVTRAWGGTTKTAITVATQNPFVSVIGTAFPEGDTAPDERSFLPTRRNNFTQIFRNALGATRTATRTRTRTGPIVAEMKREALLLHTHGMERAWFFGKADEVLTGTHPQRSCDGLYHVLNNLAPTRIKSCTGGELSVANLEEYLYEMFLYGSDEKVGFCGNRFILALSQAIRLAGNTQYKLETGQKEYGMNVQRLVSPYGSLVLKRHPLFSLMTGDNAGGPGTWYGMDSACAVVDMASIRYRPLKGDDTRYIPDIKTPGLDGDKSEFLTEASIEYNFANRHFWIRHAHSGIAPA